METSLEALMALDCGPDGLQGYKDERQVLLDRVESLLRDGPDKDFVIICGEREWEVHCTVLQIHSKVLAAACERGFKEGLERRLDLTDEEPSCTTALVDYLYHLNYYATDLDAEAGGALGLHTNMCILADQYDMPPLKTLAIEKFKAEILRPKFQKDSLSPEAAHDLAIAATSAYDAMEPTTEIREEIVKIAITTKALSTTNTTESEQSDFEGVVRTRVELAADIAAVLTKMCLIDRPVPSSHECRFRCPACAATFIAELSERALGTGFGNCYQCGEKFRLATWRKHIVNRILHAHLE